MSKALKAAIESNDDAAAQKALKTIKDLTRKLPKSTSPLLLACELNADQVLPLLLEAGAAAKPHEGYIALHPFCVAAEKDSTAAMRILSQHNLAPKDAIDHALFSATLGGREKTITFILDHFKPPIRQRYLELATWWKSGRILQLYLDHGADINARNSGEKNPDQTGETAAHDAASGGHADSLQLLITAGADLNARDARGQTPLMQLMQRMSELERHRRVTEEVIRKRAAEGRPVVVDATSSRRHGDRDNPNGMATLQLLLQSGADARLKDNHGNDAADYYNFGCLRQREEIDPSIEKILAEVGATGDAASFALFKALRAKDIVAIEQSIAAGADVNRTAPAFDATPLSWADSEDLVALLVKAGADPNKPTHNNTPLIAAAGSGNLPVVQALLKAGADLHAIAPHAPNSEFITNAWSAAHMNRKPDMCDYLKSLGAGNPVRQDWKPMEPGVGVWENFSEVVVKGDVKHVAAALAKVIAGTVTHNVYGTSVMVGKRSYLVVRPVGMAWCNVLQVTPHRGLLDRDDKFLRELAKTSGYPVLLIEYSDAADAAEIERFEPDGTSTRDSLADRDMLEEIVENLGDRAPAWVRTQLAQLKKAGGDPPSSTKRVELLAEAEKFTIAWGGLDGQPGSKTDVEFTGIPKAAFDDSAWVTN